MRISAFLWNAPLTTRVSNDRWSFVFWPGLRVIDSLILVAVERGERAVAFDGALGQHQVGLTLVLDLPGLVDDDLLRRHAEAMRQVSIDHRQGLRARILRGRGIGQLTRRR